MVWFVFREDYYHKAREPKEPTPPIRPPCTSSICNGPRKWSA
jgi:hypothetical protein